MLWLLKAFGLLGLTLLLAWGGLILSAVYLPNTLYDLLAWSNTIPNRIEDTWAIPDAYMKWVRVLLAGSPVVILIYELVSRLVISGAVAAGTRRPGVIWRMFALYAVSVVVGYALVVYLALKTDELINTALRLAGYVQTIVVQYSGTTDYSRLVLDQAISPHGLVVLAGFIVVRSVLSAVSALLFPA
jgi:hypothetical protein